MRLINPLLFREYASTLIQTDDLNSQTINDLKAYKSSWTNKTKFASLSLLAVSGVVV